MTLFEFASTNDVEPLIKSLGDRGGLPELTIKLMREVANIPYVCGKPACIHPGCIEIRNAHETARELLRLVSK